MAQGHNGRALDELRRLRLREQLIRTDGLETREKVIEWQVDLRHRQQHGGAAMYRHKNQQRA